MSPWGVAVNPLTCTIASILTHNMPKRKRESVVENGQNESSSDQGQKGGQNLVEVLPGITRKITACAACRKNKVSAVTTKVELSNVSRSAATCPTMALPASDVVAGGCRAFSTAVCNR